MNILLSTSVLIFLGIAVITDLSVHRISNILILAGLICSAVIQSWLYGFSGMTVWLIGLAVGLVILLPLYAFAGMAAGDVELMAMVGKFFGPVAIFWSAAYVALPTKVSARQCIKRRPTLTSWKINTHVLEDQHSCLGRPTLN